MTELTVLNGATIQSLLTIPMAVRAVEQAYLERAPAVRPCGPWCSTSSPPVRRTWISSPAI